MGLVFKADFFGTCGQFGVNQASDLYDANKNIGSWINPNALTGILLMIMFFWLCQWTLSMLAAIQTPTVMLEKTIDWGKVEKTEE